jgi:hypothetical protein
LQRELEEAKKWAPNLFDLFSDADALGAQNKKKIEGLSKVLQVYAHKLDRIKSMIEYRDLLLKSQTLTQQIAKEKENVRQSSGNRIEVLAKYLDLMDTFEDSMTLAIELSKQNFREDMAGVIKKAQEAKLGLESKEQELEKKVEDLHNIKIMKKRFNAIYKELKIG